MTASLLLVPGIPQLATVVTMTAPTPVTSSTSLPLLWPTTFMWSITATFITVATVPLPTSSATSSPLLVTGRVDVSRRFGGLEIGVVVLDRFHDVVRSLKSRGLFP